MPNYTTKYNLTKPLSTELYDIEVQNDNMDKIEEVIDSLTADDVGAIPSTGGKITGNLDFKKVDNGEGSVYKNHNADSDYGMIISDKSASGKTAKIGVSANENETYFFCNDGGRHRLYGEHNQSELTADIAHNVKLYNDLSQIGITVGSETIKDIATKLPTFSRLTVPVGGTNNTSIYPNGNYGLLEVDKSINSRIVFKFTNNASGQWLGTYSISSTGDTWSDWKMVYTSAFLTYGTVDLVDGTTVLPTNRVHLVYEE